MFGFDLSVLAAALAAGCLAAFVTCAVVSLDMRSRSSNAATGRVKVYLSSSALGAHASPPIDARGSKPGRVFATYLAEAEISVSRQRVLAWLALGGVGIGAILFATTGLAPVAFAGSVGGPVVALWVYASRRRSTSRRRLVDQVPVLLDALSNAMRAGSTLPQAISQAAEDMKPPIAHLLRRASAAYRVGRPLDEVLVDLQKRVNLPVMQFVVASILVNRDAGGSLAPLLVDAAELVRDDLRLQRELDVATAQVRLSARLVSLLPVVLLGGLGLTNPGSLAPFFSSPAGVLMLVGAGLLDGVGFVLVLRASRVEF